LNQYPKVAGSVSALLGVLQFAVGAAATQVVALGGNAIDVVMSVVLGVSSVLALITFAVLARNSQTKPLMVPTSQFENASNP
jgi:DHA1 family bicyclomycin/chloramphenicol resistance-like MFS transporter